MLDLLKHQFDKKIGNYSYSFKASIGQGSFSNVYLGSDDEGNPFAVKVIDKKKINHEYYAGLLNNEIKTMKKLIHKNIVRLFDVLHTSNNFYIVTEFCEGGDLSKILETKKQLPVSEALSIFKDLLEGFKEMNSHCIIHRDIKPPNIYISKGVFKIGDFGFAKVVASLNEEIRTPLIGTPLYTPPQCLQEYPYSSKCDIWSLAVVLYEMIFGTTPYNANNHLELVSKYYQVPLIIPERIDVPKYVYDFIRKSIVIQEPQRISWEKVFQHEIYKQNESLPVPKEIPNKLRIQFSNIENTVNTPIHKEILQNSFTKVDTKKTNDVQLKKVTFDLPEKEEVKKFVENVKKQIDFIFSKNIVSSLTLEKLRFLVSKHLHFICLNTKNEHKREFEALFFVLSCNSYFISEAQADKVFSQVFNVEQDDEKLKNAIIMYLRYEIRELNHELQMLPNQKASVELVHALGVLCSYYEMMEKGSFPLPKGQDGDQIEMKKKIYSENI